MVFDGPEERRGRSSPSISRDIEEKTSPGSRAKKDGDSGRRNTRSDSGRGDKMQAMLERADGGLKIMFCSRNAVPFH